MCVLTKVDTATPAAATAFTLLRAVDSDDVSVNPVAVSKIVSELRRKTADCSVLRALCDVISDDDVDEADARKADSAVVSVCAVATSVTPSVVIARRDACKSTTLACVAVSEDKVCAARLRS